MLSILLVIVLLPTTTTVYGQLFQEEEIGSVSEPQACDSQKESTLVTDLDLLYVIWY
jgi:hypothetical protein